MGWLKLGKDFVNLELIVSIHIARDDDGTWAATLETMAGNVKRYTGVDAEAIMEHLDGLTAERTTVE
jgi:hypothetical protein